jgi:hypothetical protein
LSTGKKFRETPPAIYRAAPLVTISSIPNVYPRGFKRVANKNVPVAGVHFNSKLRIEEGFQARQNAEDSFAYFSAYFAPNG